MMIQKLKKEHPKIEEFQRYPINNQIASNLQLFIKDPNQIITALIQDPFSPYNAHEGVKETFGEEVSNQMKQLERLYDLDEKILEEYEENKHNIILYLINHKFFFKEQDTYPQISILLSKDRVAYAMKLLEKSNVSEIRSDLEDQFFSFLEPKVYSHYNELLKFTNQSYQQREADLKHRLKILGESMGINLEVQSRLKSIFSIHKKITNKKILYSQILDTIGLRLIVDNDKECYQLMGAILKNWPIISNKVKDYIAVPKQNGYQSIHLTIMDGEQPVEIQIRTREMHHYAQYGDAAHHEYKAKNP